MTSLKSLAAAAAVVAFTGGAQAALVARGGGMIYDTVHNITWLQNWNMNGPMDWATAKNWANDLVYGGFDDWRLPTSNMTAGSNCEFYSNPGPQYFGHNCTGSELGHMFYIDFGATADQAVTSGSNATNLALFTNIQDFVYWTSTEYPNPYYAFGFATFGGVQDIQAKLNSRIYAVAVRDGDVPAAVPEPQTWALVLLGLGAAMVVRRRRVS